MNWQPLDSLQQLEAVIERSYTAPCLIFKHSTRCSISFMAKMRLESAWDLQEGQVAPFFLDLIAHRAVSNAVAERLSVHHESPQILLVKDGECVLDASHMDINVDEIKKTI
jgi:bacillithiol system protein YtxJ